MAIPCPFAADTNPAIIEQATHFCDLSRYFGGEVILDSVTAHTVEHDDLPGHLSAKRFNEDAIPESHRIPRLTASSWKYSSGAVGSLMHVIALHGKKSLINLRNPLSLTSRRYYLRYRVGSLRGRILVETGRSLRRTNTLCPETRN